MFHCKAGTVLISLLRRLMGDAKSFNSYPLHLCLSVEALKSFHFTFRKESSFKSYLENERCIFSARTKDSPSSEVDYFLRSVRKTFRGAD